MFKDTTVFVGLDLGDKRSDLCLLDRDGQVIEESRISTTAAALKRKFSSLRPCQVAMEVGAHSRWVSALLTHLGHEVLVADARKLRLIYSNPRKHDRADAEYLARLARLDPKLLSPIHHRNPQAQADLAILRARDSLVRSRTQLINHARGLVKATGARLPSCSAHSFHRKAATAIPTDLLPALSPILATIGSLTQCIQAYDRQIDQLAQTRYPETRLLRNVSGVGPLTSLAFVLTLEDPHRFRKSREVGACLGLVPRRDQSGRQDPQLHITKTGDSYLRRLLVQSAQYILGPFGPDCDLRRWGLKLAERGGKNAKKRAFVATARKLAVLLHRLWKNGEIYQPFHGSQASAPPTVFSETIAQEVPIATA
ncbi:MAG: IS110 family transposase [Anaerolineales bacterium]